MDSSEGIDTMPRINPKKAKGFRMKHDIDPRTITRDKILNWILYPKQKRPPKKKSGLKKNR